MAAPLSPAAAQAGVEARFLSEYVRPCRCPLDLRQEHGLIVCSLCGRPFIRRVVTRG